MNLKKASLLLLAAGLAPLANAQVEVLFVGGNSTVKLIQDRWVAAGFGGTFQANATNANIFRYAGATVPGVAGSVNADFNLTGGGAAVKDLKNLTPTVIFDNTKVVPKAAISGTQPETVGIDSTIFTVNQSLVLPVVYVKSTKLPNDLAGITNITQRNASYLESASGTLPTGYFGGSNTNISGTFASPLYFVGRNSASAARDIVDANIYFSGAPANWTTNGAGLPVKWAGAGSGTVILGILDALTNSIGILSAQDVGTRPTLAYEGVTFSTTNVINGSYPIWGVEDYLYYPSGLGAPSTDQLTVINALFAQVTDQQFQHTNSLFVNKFVAIPDLQVARVGDGGPIHSIVY